MAITLSNLHLKKIARDLGNDSDIRFRFYTNDVTPSANSVLADFTAAGTGGHNLSDLISGAPSINAGWAEQGYLAASGVFSGEVTIYGCFWMSVGAGDSTLIHAHRFATSVFVPDGTQKEISVEFKTKARQV